MLNFSYDIARKYNSYRLSLPVPKAVIYVSSSVNACTFSRSPNIAIELFYTAGKQCYIFKILISFVY